jgi:hypothetical protein
MSSGMTLSPYLKNKRLAVQTMACGAGSSPHKQEKNENLGGLHDEKWVLVRSVDADAVLGPAFS